MSISTGVNKASSAPANRRVIRIGVFIPTECQFLDAAGVDIFGSLSYEYLSVLDESMCPPPVVNSAPSVQIHYVGCVPAGHGIPMTSNMSVLATNHFDDPEVAPGKLDIVYVPGPNPFAPLPAPALAWLRSQAEVEGVDILSVCTGIVVCGEAGLLKGRSVCGPRGLKDFILARGYEPKSLKGDELRWIQDGNFWSSGEFCLAYSPALPLYFSSFTTS